MDEKTLQSVKYLYVLGKKTYKPYFNIKQDRWNIIFSFPKLQGP